MNTGRLPQTPTQLLPPSRLFLTCGNHNGIVTAEVDSNMERRNQYGFVSIVPVREAARLLGIHVNTVRRWSDLGILKAYRIGPRGDRRFNREDITAFLRETEAIVTRRSL